MTKQTAQPSAWPFNSPALRAPDLATAEDRRAIVARLHRSYLNLVMEMAALQSAWDAEEERAFDSAAAAGWNLGAAWRDDAAPVFDDAFWRELAPKDLTALVDDSALAAGSANRAEHFLRRRDAVLAMPCVLAGGDGTAMRKLLASALPDFDTAYAHEIIDDEEFDAILRSFGRDESVRAYLAYVGLMMTAVPPTFYAFVAGKGAPCLMLETVVLAVGALVSGSNATAVRIWDLEERFNELEVNNTPARRELNVDGAVAALLRMLDDFRRAAADVHQLLATARPAQARLGGIPTLSEQMAAIVAGVSCRDCGSEDHTTTMARMGTVEYE